MMEEAGVLYLLGGIPRQWLEAGKKIEVKRGRAYFGSWNLDADSQADRGRILVDLQFEKRHPERLREIWLRVPHPQKQGIREVMINGRSWRDFDRKREVIMIKPAENHYAIVVQY
jgi:hypothetical protein